MAHSPTIQVDGTSVPRMFYGTAWKEERTEKLTQLALICGFRAIDTANQRKHYFEEGVGQGVKAFRRCGLVSSLDPNGGLVGIPGTVHALQRGIAPPLFLQTKFTFQGGQDHRLPYDPKAPISQQVAQSFHSSQQHLGEKISSLVLHGPMYRSGLAAEDWDAWRAMEGLAQQGKVRFLGISNVSAGQLKRLLAGAKIPPRFVQNRCFAAHGWDREVRQICRDNGLTYQGFSLLTANRQIFADPQLRAFAQQNGCTAAQLIYSFALHVGMIVLTGTSNEKHIREALQSLQVDLGSNCVEYLEQVGER